MNKFVNSDKLNSTSIWCAILFINNHEHSERSISKSNKQRVKEYGSASV
jgi:hypothetical protein